MGEEEGGRGGRKGVADEEGPYFRAEPLKPWKEGGQEALESNSMKRRTLAAPRVAGGVGGRHQMPRRAS